MAVFGEACAEPTRTEAPEVVVSGGAERAGVDAAEKVDGACAESARTDALEVVAFGWA
eukprot:CAMPEP_0117610364 /NCGR_PEP_ID=MMETSP0784-20121206/81834_1 /TAXON_ID=39447 /ORGANISM="" /LENGTH=57 /DNA_ID=CAMNT_0005413763 /DNA_START=12 /DNA_END=182 /DNA_ORIENTATION=+